MDDHLLPVVTAQALEIAALKAELAQRHDPHRTVLEHNPHPAWIYSAESLRFLDVNQAALRTYGWSRAEFLAMTIVDIRPREDVPALLESVARMRARPAGTIGPWRHRHKDGSMVEVDVSFLSFPLGGQPARLIVVDASSARPVQRAWACPPALSRRERQVLGLVARGYTSLEIAAALGLSVKSVETYRVRFARKLGLAGRAAIVKYAIDHGLLAS